MAVVTKSRSGTQRPGFHQPLVGALLLAILFPAALLAATWNRDLPVGQCRIRTTWRGYACDWGVFHVGRNLEAVTEIACSPIEIEVCRPILLFSRFIPTHEGSLTRTTTPHATSTVHPHARG